MVELKHVYKSYGTNEPFIRDLTFEVKPGEFIFLLGPSGAGKTTLFKMLTAFEKPTSGQIKILGHDLTNIKQGQIPFLRRKLGVIWQNFKLLKDRTVYENIELPLIIEGVQKADRDKRVREVLDQISITLLQDQYPDHLSGGEQQRVAIARALVGNPKIIIADEPTGNLDPQLSQSIFNLLFDLSKKGITVIVATHDHVQVRHEQSRILHLGTDGRTNLWGHA